MDFLTVFISVMAGIGIYDTFYKRLVEQCKFVSFEEPADDDEE